jgi:5-methylcytosine-specific restriction endonuclease McrA
MTVNDLQRQRVRQRAGSLCEYCHSPEKISATRFTVDHVQPRSLGGSDDNKELRALLDFCIDCINYSNKKQGYNW